MKYISSSVIASEAKQSHDYALTIAKTIGCILISAAVLFAAEDKPKIKAKQVEFKKAENKVIFTGDVVVTRGKDVLYADNAVKDEKTDTIDAWGNVKGYFLVDSSETARLTTGRIKWQTETDRMELTEHPEIIYVSTATGEISARSDLVVIENSLKTASFSGNVVIGYGKSVADSNSAKYYYNDKKIVLLKENGKIPYIKYSNAHHGDFRADIITVFMATRNMLLENNAQGLIYQ